MYAETTRRLTLAICILLAPSVPRSGASLASAQTSLTPAREDAEALAAYHRALAQADERPVRVFVYGASHTASDEYTSSLRAMLQRRFGDGGLGWVTPAQPFPYYARAGVTTSSQGFEGRLVRYRDRVRDDYGLAGFAIQSDGPARARVRVGSNLQGQRLDVAYLQVPGGGSFEVTAGEFTRRIETDGPRQTKTLTLLDSLGEVRSIAVRTSDDGPVRIFGLVAEHATGVVVDAFGVPGAQARDHRRWRERSLAAALRQRPPDLVVLAYGTNESARRAFDDDEDELRAVIRRFRQHAPGASCLLLGPGDWPRRVRGQWRRRPRTRAVTEQQRTVAHSEGCAHFDTHAFMGGDLAMVRWVQEGLGLGDYVHFSAEGHSQYARALLRPGWLTPARD